MLVRARMFLCVFACPEEICFCLYIWKIKGVFECISYVFCMFVKERMFLRAFACPKDFFLFVCEKTGCFCVCLHVQKRNVFVFVYLKNRGCFRVFLYVWKIDVFDCTYKSERGVFLCAFACLEEKCYCVYLYIWKWCFLVLLRVWKRDVCVFACLEKNVFVHLPVWKRDASLCTCVCLRKTDVCLSKIVLKNLHVNMYLHFFYKRLWESQYLLAFSHVHGTQTFACICSFMKASCLCACSWKRKKEK